MMDISQLHRDVKQFSMDGTESMPLSIAIESSVSLTVNGKTWLTFQCSPTYLKQLAIGFLYTEGFINSRDEISSIHVCDQRDNVDVWLNHAVKKPESWRRTSGCHGSSAPVDPGQERFVPINDPSLITVKQIFYLIQTFQDHQHPHTESGGVHTSALADRDQVIYYLEDIGRHNTIDKIAGCLILDEKKLNQPILLTTGRISSDMVQKAIRLKTSYIISMRSASSMAIEWAEEWGISLVCNARRTHLNAITHPERVVLDL